MAQTSMAEKGSMDENVLLGVCGLFCGACDHYCAYTPKGRHLGGKRPEGDRELEECHGCRSSLLTTSCRNCTIRKCANRRGALHCGLCSEYPCRQLKAFQHDGRIHHIPILDNLESLRKHGPKQWLLDQQQRWRCKCGQPHSWYEEQCVLCRTPLASYARPRTN